MGYEDHLWWDKFFEQVKDALAGKRFSRLPWYSLSEKVFIQVSAGAEAVALNDLFAAIRSNGGKLLRGSEPDKNEATRKIIQAVEVFLKSP
jgi:hypothetical protein